MLIQSLEPAHWPAVRAIYLEGIATRTATFEEDAPDWELWNSKHHQHSRFIAVEDGSVAGWAALSPVSPRHVYRGVAEVSIYFAGPAGGRGVGRNLIQALIESSEAHGIWTLQSAIFPENVASIRLHQRAGFRTIGERERIGQLAGEWRTTVLMERRSRVIS